jgi:hypothetical protein
MTLPNLSPAERIVSHEQKITANIQQIDANTQQIATEEIKLEQTLSQKEALNSQARPSLSDQLSVMDDEKTQHQNIQHTKEDTFALKLDTLGENKNLKQAQLDEQALNQQNITELEDAKNRSENRLNRLEEHSTQEAKQADKIAQEQAVLAKRERDLSQAKASAIAAQEASQARNAKVANEVKEKCPLQCYAASMTAKPTTVDRDFSLESTVNAAVQTLHVLSISRAGYEKGLLAPPVSVIKASVDGACEQDKLSSSARAAKKEDPSRPATGEHCPVMTISTHV